RLRPAAWRALTIIAQDPARRSGGGASRLPSSRPEARKQRRHARAVALVLPRVVEQRDEPPLLLPREPERAERERDARPGDGRVARHEEDAELQPDDRRVDRVPDDAVGARRLELDPAVVLEEGREGPDAEPDLPVGDEAEHLGNGDQRPAGDLHPE